MHIIYIRQWPSLILKRLHGPLDLQPFDHHASLERCELFVGPETRIIAMWATRREESLRRR